jgi:hypothetical protein
MSVIPNNTVVDHDDLLRRRELADIFGVHPSRISAVLNSTPGLVPMRRVGTTRLYSPAVVPLIQQRLDEMAAWGRRRGRRTAEATA